MIMDRDELPIAVRIKADKDYYDQLVKDGENVNITRIPFLVFIFAYQCFLYHDSLRPIIFCIYFYEKMRI